MNPKKDLKQATPGRVRPSQGWRVGKSLGRKLRGLHCGGQIILICSCLFVLLQGVLVVVFLEQ